MPNDADADDDAHQRYGSEQASRGSVGGDDRTGRLGADCSKLESTERQTAKVVLFFHRGRATEDVAELAVELQSALSAEEVFIQGEEGGSGWGADGAEGQATAQVHRTRRDLAAPTQAAWGPRGTRCTRSRTDPVTR